MATGITPITEFSYDGESRAPAPTDGFETKYAKTTIYWTGPIILGSLLETGRRMAGFLGNRQPQNCRRLEQEEVQTVLGKQINEPRTGQTMC